VTVTERGTLWYVNMYKRTHIQLCPEILVIFGDNLERRGLGGQAKECRGEPNCLGIPTKRSPGRNIGDYLYDLDIAQAGKVISQGFIIARDALLRGQDVAYPFSGIGSGRAQLESRAPKLKGLVDDGLHMLETSCSRTMNANNLYMVKAHLLGEAILNGKET
jgi:hypothetical protein